MPLMALPVHILTTCEGAKTHLSASKPDPAPAARNIDFLGLLATQYYLPYEVIWIVTEMGNRDNTNQG